MFGEKISVNNKGIFFEKPNYDSANLTSGSLDPCFVCSFELSLG
jgi:hypothetical protein